MIETLLEKLKNKSFYAGEFSGYTSLVENADHFSTGQIAYSVTDNKFFQLNEDSEWIHIDINDVEDIIKEKMTNIDISLYDINKQLIKQQNPLSPSKITENIKIINQYFAKTNEEYYMLLFRDINYYTIFHKENNSSLNLFGEEVIDCLKTFSAIYTIDILENNSIEIWIKPEEAEELVVGYLFPYSLGVVKFRG